MRRISVVVAAVIGLLITACAPRTVATPVPTLDVDGVTVFPAELTPLPTSAGEIPTLPAPDRAEFMAADMNSEPWAGVRQKITDAFAAGEAWADDPDQIAMEFALDQTGMPMAETIQRSDTHAIMLVTELIAEDDSVAEQQILVELSRPAADAAWGVDFIGLRWKCREGRGQQEFAPELCV